MEGSEGLAGCCDSQPPSAVTSPPGVLRSALHFPTPMVLPFTGVLTWQHLSEAIRYGAWLPALQHQTPDFVMQPGFQDLPNQALRDGCIISQNALEVTWETKLAIRKLLPEAAIRAKGN